MVVQAEWIGRENTEGSRPATATCSPHVGITLVGLCESGPLTTPPHRQAAAGYSRQGHGVGGGFGDG